MDETLKVREVGSGLELRTLKGHSVGLGRGFEWRRAGRGLSFLGWNTEGMGCRERARAAHADRA